MIFGTIISFRFHKFISFGVASYQHHFDIARDVPRRLLRHSSVLQRQSISFPAQIKTCQPKLENRLDSLEQLQQ